MSFCFGRKDSSTWSCQSKTVTPEALAESAQLLLTSIKCQSGFDEVL